MRDFGAVMLQCNFPFWNKIVTQIDEEDLYLEKADNIFGYEVEPHVTILYGLHEDVDHDKVVSDIESFKPITIKLQGVDSFEGDGYDTLKIKVDRRELLSYRNVLLKHKNTQTFPEYNAHITVAYLKKGAAKKYYNKSINFELYCDEVKYSSPNRDSVYIKLQ
jgi:2'-5' RNA ligase